MIPIEQTPQSVLVFLECGCKVLRQQNHPSGTAILVQVLEPCSPEHQGGRWRLRSVPSGTLASPFVQHPIQLLA